jgi:hypothetical protein
VCYSIFMPILYGPDGRPISGLDVSSTESTKGKKDKTRTKRQQIGKRDYKGAVLAFVSLLGFAITLLTIFPRLSVSNESQIDPNDPFSTPFRIVNDGSVPLFSVTFFMAVQNIIPRNTYVTGLKGSPHCASRIRNAGMATKVLWPTEVFTFYSGAAINTHATPLAAADICIVVQYHPFGIPINRERVFRFVTQLGPDNQLHWMQRPESE